MIILFAAQKAYSKAAEAEYASPHAAACKVTFSVLSQEKKRTLIRITDKRPGASTCDSAVFSVLEYPGYLR